MANTNYAASFDYNDYQQMILPIVSQVDRNNYKELREFTCQAIKYFQENWPLRDYGMIKYIDGVKTKVMTQEWPLYNHGGEALTTVNEIQTTTNPGQDELGYWFLIMLGRFLKPCASPGPNWSILNVVLEQLGWEQTERTFLFNGLPTSSILKPNINQLSPWPLSQNDPYWLWLHPWDSRSGWLPIGKVRELHSSILKTQDEVFRFDISNFPNINSDNPTVVEDYEYRLQDSYKKTVQMLSTAIENNEGLFMSITNYS